MPSESKKNLAIPLRFVLRILPILSICSCLGGPRLDFVDQPADMAIPDSLSKKAAVILLEEDVVEIQSGRAVIETSWSRKY